MRAIGNSWIGIGLAILFGASLFFFRGSARYSNLFNSDNIIASISGTPISTTKFVRAFEMNISQWGQMLGKQLSGDEIRSFQIHELVLQNLINNAIFENEFDSINFILDETVIAKETKRRFPNLYVNNKINNDALNSFLRQQRLKIDDLVNIISYELRSNVFDDVIFNINYPKNLQKKISLYDQQTRKIDLIKIELNKIILENYNRNTILKDNKELLEYFDKNTVKYMTDETRDLSFLILDKAKYIDKFSPSNFEMNEYFTNNKELFILPETRTFKQFNFKSEEEAMKFKDDISSLSIENITNYINENNIQFNIFESLNKNQVLEELALEIFSLEKNTVSNTIKTALAYHVIIIDKINYSRAQKYEEVEKEIKDTLTNVQLDNFYNELKLEIEQQVLDGFSLKEISEKNSIDLKSINKALISNNNNTNDLENSIISSGFSQNKDLISDLIQYDNNISYLVNVDTIIPSMPKNIDKIFDIVLNDFLREKKIKYFEEMDSNNLEDIESKFNTNIEEIELNLENKILPINFIVQIFESDVNKTVFSSDNENFYFAKTKRINIPNNTEKITEISLISDLKNSFGTEIIKSKKISINNKLVDGLLSQYK